jgi:glycosyltransferase involved in cell wall biosynthesis
MRMRGAAFVAACTRQGRDRIEELLRTEPPARVVLCPHGVFPADFTPGPAEGRSILAVGRLEPKKGLRHLVAACRILAADGEDFRCAIVGDGSERAGLRKEAERAGLAERLTFTGALTGEALIERYREAALFVLPSVVAPDGDRDGLANVVLEAMAMGLPVVGTDASSCAEAVIDGVNGFLVPAGDAPALAESLKRLLRDPALRQRMGARNRTVVEERFDIRRNVETLAAQFKSGA